MVRGLDYLPMVDVTFGDGLRAVVTSDCRLYPEDQVQARVTLVACLRTRGIYSRGGGDPERRLIALVEAKPAVQVGAEVPIHDFIRDATLDLDPAGTPGAYRASDRSGAR